jgi:hypothetical protein
MSERRLNVGSDKRGAEKLNTTRLERVNELVILRLAQILQSRANFLRFLTSVSDQNSKNNVNLSLYLIFD